MKLNLDQTSVPSISAYSKHGITIGGRLLVEPFVAVGDDILTGSLPLSVGAVGPQHIEKLLAFEQSIILVGTGETQVLFDPEVLRPALEAQVGIEVMKTAAACRCYNVLVAENRAVLGVFYMP